MQERVAVKAEGQVRYRHRDVFQRRHAHGLGHSHSRQHHGRESRRVAPSHGDRPSAPGQDPANQRRGIEGEEHRCCQRERTERPVEQDHHRAGELGREDRSGGEAAPQVVLGRDEQEDGQAELERERPWARPYHACDDVYGGQAGDQSDHGPLHGERHP